MRNIRIYPDPILRKKSTPISNATKETLDISQKMIEIMYANDGVGLAAPQIGISEQIITVDYGEGPMVLFNPEIIESSEEKNELEEGCLSFPDITVPILRPIKIKIKFLNEENKISELSIDNIAAKVFQHEIDHLNGILIIDHISSLKKAIINSKLKKLEKLYSAG